MDAERWNQIEQLYNQALERPSEERSAFLTEACQADDNLRREVESLLNAKTSGFLEQPALDVAAKSMARSRPSFAAGDSLNHYSILSLLGAGAMAEVYRARDTKLNRDVAIKVLPSGFAKDRHRISRLHREAQVLASLNHPHIGSIYGLEQDTSSCALVLELVEGETLADRISRGPIPVREALDIGSQIARALRAAHANGIIHRDLKPANIKITPDGIVKVLDFGLAKIFAREKLPAELHSGTLIETKEQIILGTVCYMSPEQARGKTLDRRTDIWAWACVMYEMLTGKLAYGGDTMTGVIAKIASEEPDWSILPETAPPAVRRLLRDCLEKDPDRRPQSVTHVEAELEKASSELSGVPRRVVLRRMRYGLIALAALAVAAVVFVRRPAPSPTLVPIATEVSQPAQPSLPAAPNETTAVAEPPDAPPPPEIKSFTIDLPNGWHLPIGFRPTVAVSADGSTFVFAAQNGSMSQLWMATADRRNPAPIPATDDAVLPFLSPDGKWIAYATSGGAVRRIPIGGGTLQALCLGLEAPPIHGGFWGVEGIFVAVGNRLLQMPCGANTGSPSIGQDDLREYSLPQSLPGGRLLYTRRNSWPTAFGETFIESPGTHERKTVLTGALSARYLSSGHLIYIVLGKTSQVSAIRFDLERREVKGSPFTVMSNVFSNFGVPDLDVSNDGTLIYAERPVGSGGMLVWVDQRGEETPLATPSSTLYVAPRLSPDGQKIAFSGAPAALRGLNNWLWDVTREAPSELKVDGVLSSGIWMPDSKKIIFHSQKDGRVSLYSMPVDNTSPPQRLDVPSAGAALAVSESHLLAYRKYNTETRKNDIWIHPLNGGTDFAFLQSDADHGCAAFSPDGLWLAYCADAGSGSDVYITPFPGPGPKTKISQNGGNEPAWARDGRQVFFRDRKRGLMMAVDMSFIPSLRPGQPRPLFRDSSYLRLDSAADYDVTADGRFLMVKNNVIPVTQIHVVQNWFEELKQLTPPAR